MANDLPSNLRVVLAGCGGISAEWLRDIHNVPAVQIVGLVDINESAAKARAEEFNLPDALIETDLVRALDATAPDIVFDCTVPAAHVDVTLEALRHGCHVLGEKPLADTMDNARKMVKAAQESGKVYAVMQNRRFDPNIRRTRALLQSGAIGALTTVHSDFFIGLHISGFRLQMSHVLLIDMAIHTFDAARYLTGADPVSVYCEDWNARGSWWAHGASAVAIFHMTDGIVYTYRGSWSGEGLITTWESDWRMIGERGTIRWDGTAKIEAERAAGLNGHLSTHEVLPAPDDPTPDLVAASGHAALIRDFIDCIRTGRTPQTVCTDNIKSLAMVYGAIESAETGKSAEIHW